LLEVSLPEIRAPEPGFPQIGPVGPQMYEPCQPQVDTTHVGMHVRETDIGSAEEGPPQVDAARMSFVKIGEVEIGRPLRCAGKVGTGS